MLAKGIAEIQKTAINLSEIKGQEKILEEEFNTTHSIEYISSLWRKKIPQLLASVAEDEYLDYYYLEVEKGHYKKCNRCGITEGTITDHNYTEKLFAK